MLTENSLPFSAPPQPSVWRMLQVDFPCFIAAALPLVTFALGIAIVAFGQIPGIHGRDDMAASDLPYLLVFGSLLAAICVPLLVLRIHRLRRLLTHGQQTTGIILQAYRAGNGSRLRFSYNFDGKQYERLLRTPSWIDDLGSGSRVAIIVNPDHPRRSLIAELYS